MYLIILFPVLFMSCASFLSPPLGVEVPQAE